MAAMLNMDKKWGQGWQTMGNCVATILFIHFSFSKCLLSILNISES